MLKVAVRLVIIRIKSALHIYTGQVCVISRYEFFGVTFLAKSSGLLEKSLGAFL